MESDETVRVFACSCCQLREIKCSAVITLFCGIRDAFERGWGMIEFAGDFDAEFWMPHDGVIIDGDSTIRCDKLSIGCQHQRIDFQ